MAEQSSKNPKEKGKSRSNVKPESSIVICISWAVIIREAAGFPVR
jgi:hypothetical protein